jgi:hypothetical protein
LHGFSAVDGSASRRMVPLVQCPPARRVTRQRLSSVMPLYHATLTCAGLTKAEGNSAPPHIVEEFRHRPWHQNVTCKWANGLLHLDADNDYDRNGKALLDEFMDAVVACVKASGDIHFEIVSVQRVSVEA